MFESVVQDPFGLVSADGESVPPAGVYVKAEIVGRGTSVELAELAGVPMRVLQRAAAEAKAAGPAEAEVLVATTVVLAVLRAKFGSQTALWEGLVRKSESGPTGTLGTNPVLTGGLSLEEWAAGLV